MQLNDFEWDEKYLGGHIEQYIKYTSQGKLYAIYNREDDSLHMSLNDLPIYDSKISRIEHLEIDANKNNSYKRNRKYSEGLTYIEHIGERLRYLIGDSKALDYLKDSIYYLPFHDWDPLNKIPYLKGKWKSALLEESSIIEDSTIVMFLVNYETNAPMISRIIVIKINNIRDENI